MKISAALVGSYNCVEKSPGPEDPPDILELRRDGTATLAVRSPKRAANPGWIDPGFLSVEGDSGVLTLRDGEPRQVARPLEPVIKRANYELDRASESFHSDLT